MDRKPPLRDRAFERTATEFAGQALALEKILQTDETLAIFRLNRSKHIRLEITEDTIDEIHEDRRRAEALCERFPCSEIRPKVGFDLLNQARCTAAPAVDRLLRIANQQEATRARGIGGTKDLAHQWS